MNGFANRFGLFRRSIAARWVAAVALVAGLGIVAMVAISTREMHKRLEAEGETMQRLAEQKTADRIDSEITLVNQRLREMIAGLENDLAVLANLPTTAQAIRSRNDARIAELIGKRLRRFGFAGGLVLDHRLTVIGMDKAGADLLGANAALRSHELRATFRELLDGNDPGSPLVYRFVGQFDAGLAAILLAPLNERYGYVLATPVFDQFGEPIGLVLAYALLRSSEPMLVDFASTTNAALLLAQGRNAISVAGPIRPDVELPAENSERLARASGTPYSGRCAASLPGLSLCVLRHDDEIVKFRNELLAIGAAEAQALTRLLIVLGGATLVAVVLLIALLTRHLVRPLTEITRAVERVAGGEWRVEVPSAEREDEVGMIARAVASMQVSLIERDRMRQEMLRIDAINQRRLTLDKAVGRFEEGMAVVMRNIAGTVHTLSLSSEALDRSARDADRQAERIRTTSLDTASKTSLVTGATLQLSEGIREIDQRLKSTNSAVFASEDRLRETGLQVNELGGVARDAEEALAKVQSLVADLGHLALSALVDTARNGEGNRAHARSAGAVRNLAAQTADATSHIAIELARLTAVADGANAALDSAKSGLGEALRETGEISLVVAEQNAAAREIADGLDAAASAMTGLSDAVAALRFSISGAHEATGDFIATARRIVEDARAIDESIRLFVREAAA